MVFFIDQGNPITIGIFKAYRAFNGFLVIKLVFGGVWIKSLMDSVNPWTSLFLNLSFTPFGKIRYWECEL